MCCEVDSSLDFKKALCFPGIEGEKIKFFRYYGIGTEIEKELKELTSVDYEELKLRVNKAKLVKFDTSSCSTSDLKLVKKKRKTFINVMNANKVL